MGEMCSTEVGRNTTLRGKMFVKPAFAAKSAVINFPTKLHRGIKTLVSRRTAQ